MTAIFRRESGIAPNRATSGVLPGRSMTAWKPVRGPCVVWILAEWAAAALLVSCVPAAAAARAASTPATTTTACQSTALPVPAGTTESSVNGGDPTGRYLVGVGFHVGGSEGLLWVDAQLKPLDQSPLALYIQVQFNAVNRSGAIVGERLTSDTSFHTDAFVYRHGRFTLLAAPHPGDSTQALAIDSRGDIVGGATGTGGRQPVEWPADRPGTVRLLPTAGQGAGVADGIDQDGTAVGYVGFYPTGIAYVWPAHGRAYQLAVPAGSLGSNAAAISNGMAAGDVLDPATGSSALTEWNLRTGQFRIWPSLEGAALSINRWGTIGVAGGEIVHADGREVPVTGWPNAVTDRGTAAEFNGHAVLWRGC
jgi:hypothetical protein